MRRLALAAILAASFSCAADVEVEVSDVKIPDELRAKLTPDITALLDQAANSNRYTSNFDFNPNSHELYRNAIDKESDPGLKERIAQFATNKLWNDAYTLVNSSIFNEQTRLGMQRLTESIQIDPSPRDRDKSILWGINHLDEYYRRDTEHETSFMSPKVALGFLKSVRHYATSTIGIIDVCIEQWNDRDLNRNQ